jgi:hypothetical protein
MNVVELTERTPGFLGCVLMEGDRTIGFVAGYAETFVDGVDFYIKNGFYTSEKMIMMGSWLRPKDEN